MLSVLFRLEHPASALKQLSGSDRAMSGHCLTGPPLLLLRNTLHIVETSSRQARCPGCSEMPKLKSSCPHCC